MNPLSDANAQETNTELKLQKSVRHNLVKIFKCSECGLTFDRASQLGYHHRSIHLGERSQICQICGKGFFRKADLRTHLNIHLGTNFCICEFCGRRFNHISNLIRHCRVHAGVKPYLCSICERRFTQVSSLVRHKQIIHGIPKESMRQYCSSSLISNKSQVTKHASKENETTDNNVKDKYHEKICTELKVSQDTDRGADVQRNKILNQHEMNSTAITTYLPLETVIYVTSKQFEENNLAEIENRLSQDYLAGIEEKLQSIDLSTNKTVTSNLPQDTVGNHKQTPSKDNIIYLHQLDRNSFTFLPRDRGPGNADVHAIQDFKEDFANDVEKSLDIGTNLQTCNSDQVPAYQKFLHKQMCKEIISEDRKYDKPSLNDDNQLYIELSELGLLKFDESRYCSNTDLEAVKSDHSANIAADDLTYTSVSAQNQDNLARNEENPQGLNNPNNIVLNNEDPMLRMVQTEAGEQFYEFISNLVEKMQDTSSAENTGDKAEEPSGPFGHCQSTGPRDSRENNEKSDRTEHQQALEDLADINNEFNYTQFDFHRDEKSFTVLCDNESESFQQDSQESVCTIALQEKNLQAYSSGNLELLENESHVDFDKYVETNFEVFERLNYENCNERFFEFVEVADIGVESSSGNKESPMVRLIQNDGDQLLELLQDCQITEQKSDFISASKLDEDCSNVLQDSNKIVNCTEGKPDFFAYVENNTPLEENMNSDRNTAGNGDRLYTSLIINNDMSNKNTSDENCVSTSKELKEPKSEKSEKPEKSKISPKKYQCSVCKKAFSTAYNYKQHIGIHFTDQQKFHCKECGVSFAWKSTLNKHIASIHSSNWPPKFACEICSRIYSTLSQVNEHVKRDHLKQRNHVCDYCGKSFFKSFDLKTHSRTHTNERPYACRVCGKRFHHQSHIIRHERTHSGERPYVCVVCQKAFIQPSSLKVHEQKHR